jgi:hypothetical protein
LLIRVRVKGSQEKIWVSNRWQSRGGEYNWLAASRSSYEPQKIQIRGCDFHPTGLQLGRIIFEKKEK